MEVTTVAEPRKTDSRRIDPFTVRQDFPILRRRFHGKPLVYLDSAATTQKPLAVIESLSDFYSLRNANVHRAFHNLAEEATELFEGSRREIQSFLGARSPAEIVFTRGTTESVNLVAASWGRSHLEAGDEILLTEMEHHSNLVPWQLLAAEKNLKLRFIPVNGDGALDLARAAELISGRTKLVSFTHVSNVLGTVNPVADITKMAHDAGALVFVDSAQGAPHLPLSVAELDCDFLAFSGHKACGPTGIGVLYGREKLLEAMPPYMGGGEMIRSVSLDRAEWNDLPHKFEAGTPNVAGAVGLGVAIRYLSKLGMPAIQHHERALTDYLKTRISDIPGLELHSGSTEQTGIVSFTIEGVHPHDAAQYLNQEAIAVRAGHHCAQPLIRKLGVPATVRASLYVYNTESDIDKLTDAVLKTKEFFRRGL